MSTRAAVPGEVLTGQALTGTSAISEQCADLFRYVETIGIAVEAIGKWRDADETRGDLQ